MSRLIIIVIIAFSSSLLTAKIKINSYTIQVKKKNEKDIVQVLKGRKKISSYILERFDTTPKLIKLKKLEHPKGTFFLIDYFKGYQGTSIVNACSDIYLFEVTAEGKLILHQKETYYCECSSEKPSKDCKNFNKPFYLDLNKPKIVFLTPEI